MHLYSSNRVEKFSTKSQFWSKFCGYLGPALIPPAHIAVLFYFWSDYTRHVDRYNCQCSCWDTVFKGPYESGIASYKHMYFNATPNFLKIWVLTITCILALYESIRYLILLAIERRLRISMFILYSSSIFSHYYSWWMYVNYWNDDYYPQWNHQLFFTLTELTSSILILQFADSKVSITNFKSLCIVGIAVLHVFTGGLDQFVRNVLFGEGRSHQVVRDIGFMVPDLLNIILPLIELKRSKSLIGLDAKILRKEIFYLCVLETIAFIVWSTL